MAGLVPGNLSMLGAAAGGDPCGFVARMVTSTLAVTESMWGDYRSANWRWLWLGVCCCPGRNNTAKG
eukprot:COSAG01_NODE_9949_length_2294_cov_3.324829_1_plen_66_part_10